MAQGHTQDYLKQFQNYQQENNHYNLLKLRVKNRQFHQKQQILQLAQLNLLQSRLGKIFDNFSLLKRHTAILIDFTQKYIQTKKLKKKHQQLIFKKQKTNQQLELLNLLDQQNPRIIRMINRIIHPMNMSQQAKNIQHCLNKLKLLIIKTKYKQTTKLQYIIEPYSKILKKVLEDYFPPPSKKQQTKIDVKFSNQDHVRNQFILKALITIRNRFQITTFKQIKYNKLAPFQHLDLQNKLYKYIIKFSNSQKQVQEYPYFFINFSNQPLLYIQNQLIQFNRLLLFCPLVSPLSNLPRQLQKQILLVQISKYYLNQLQQQSIDWANQQLLLQFYHTDTSTIKPIIYSYLKTNQKMIIVKIRSIVTDRQLQEINNFNCLFSTLILIRKFVYIRIIMNYLRNIFNVKKNQNIQIPISSKFYAKIKTTNKIQYSTQQASSPILKNQIMTNLLNFLIDKSKDKFKKRLIRQKITSIFQATLLKIIGQTTNHIFHWPLDSASMGEWYYQIVKDKYLVRGEVKKFIQHF